MNTKRLTDFKTVAIAGIAGITLNTLLLKLAPALGIMAESGGLLKVVFKILPALSAHPFLHAMAFWLIFHYLTGFAMVVLYFLMFTRLRVNKWVKGGLFSFIPWLINGMIVLPLLGQGIMGANQLPVSGIVYFFFANLSFALLLSGISESGQVSSGNRSN